MKNGTFHNIPFDEYRSWDAVNNSLLKVVSQKSPFHAKYELDTGGKDTQPLSFGRAVHTYVLEPELFDSFYAVAPECDRRTKAGKETWAAFTEGADGKTVLTDVEHATILAMSERLQQTKAIEYLKGGKEVSLLWTDEKTGLDCKCRIDNLIECHDAIIDLKTSTSASPEYFRYAMKQFGYGQAAAWYWDGYKAVTGREPSFYMFVVMEKNPPYDVGLYVIGDDSLTAGRNIYRKAFDLWADCLKKDEFPGYTPVPQEINLPDWFLKINGSNEYQE